MADYLNIIYNKNTRPINEYPGKLINHLINKYQLKKGSKLLEPGVGRGEFLMEFQKRGIECYGVDISSFAGMDFKNIEVKTGIDIDNDVLPYQDNFFDIIYSKSFMEHLVNPEHFLKEAFRVLKPGGKIICMIPDWEANYKIYFDDHTHKTPFTIQSLEDILKICDFKEVNVIKFRQLPITWKYPLVNLISKIISPFIRVRTKNKFLRWSRELMLIGYGEKTI
ncbi:MAG: methyltransferase [Pelagibacterales bacterium]|nr:methyltransferase [Pelagibacterales bacterium]|tara:strand:- start:476 stop:1144 length:669 start_codon:yes stop_codon:yes gene_type:complete